MSEGRNLGDRLLTLTWVHQPPPMLSAETQIHNNNVENLDENDAIINEVTESSTDTTISDATTTTTTVPLDTVSSGKLADEDDVTSLEETSAADVNKSEKDVNDETWKH